MAEIMQFQKRRPSNIQPYIDCDKGWKFTEDDKEFLMEYYREWIKVCIKGLNRDGIEGPIDVLNSLIENGVEGSKDLIQEDARDMAEAVNNDIYNYYAEFPDNLKLIENSILDVKW